MLQCAIEWRDTLKPTVLQDVVVGIYFNTQLVGALQNNLDWQRALALCERAWSLLPEEWLEEKGAGRLALR